MMMLSSLFLMASLYAGIGVLHLIKPKAFLFVMPKWMPYAIPLIYLSGLAEILLGALLIPETTRAFSAWSIIVMLIIYFFVNHITQAIDFYKRKHRLLFAAIIRLPVQFFLIWWAWQYT